MVSTVEYWWVDSEVLCGILFESKFDLKMEIIESYIHFSLTPASLNNMNLEISILLNSPSDGQEKYACFHLCGLSFPSERFTTSEKKNF